VRRELGLAPETPTVGIVPISIRRCLTIRTRPGIWSTAASKRTTCCCAPFRASSRARPTQRFSSSEKAVGLRAARTKCRSGRSRRSWESRTPSDLSAFDPTSPTRSPPSTCPFSAR
jgi:hypothetical protein